MDTKRKYDKKLRLLAERVAFALEDFDDPESAMAYVYGQLLSARDAERERQEWLWCAALINALDMSGIQAVTGKFLEFRETLGHMSAEQLREFAGEKTHEIAAAIREGE